MKYETCLVPAHTKPVPADLRGKRQALFFLLAQSQQTPNEIPDQQHGARGPRIAKPTPDSASAPHRLSTILSSDDFQFTF
jgi:hypothetical protein